MNPVIAPAVRAAASQTFQNRTLRIVALYDSHRAQANAHATIEALTRTYGNQMRIECRAWNFDMLTRLDLRHASARTASNSDVMIVAARSAAVLPPHVKSWMTTCLRQHSSTMPVMVAVYEEDPRRSDILPAFRRDLISIASSWRTPLLCNGEFAEHAGRQWLLPTRHPGSHSNPPSLVKEAFFAPYTGRGGINE